MCERSRPSARRHLYPRWMVLALLAALCACGGGGGAGGGSGETAPPTGLAGAVLLPDFDLGLIAEREPNNTAAQAFRLPPAWPRCRFEIAGLLGTSDALYGRVDPIDAFRFVSLEAQEITLEVRFAGIDPVGGGNNDVVLAVFDTATGIPLANSGGGAQPRSLIFDAEAGRSYDVIVQILQGHGPYGLRFIGADPAQSPKPRSPEISAPAAPRSPSPTAAYGADAPPCAGTHVIVRMKDDCGPGSFCSRKGLRLGRRMGSGSVRVKFDVAAGEDPARKALALGAELAADPDVAWAEPDWIVRPHGEPDDAEYARQWNLHAVGAAAAWNVVTGDPSIVVGVIDSGIVEHPDLTNQVVPGYDFMSIAAMAADGDGRDPDPTDPGDRYASSGLSVWHGTHVAGIVAAAQNDGYGLSGIAPGCRVMPLRVLGVGGGLASDAADAILFSAGLLTTADGTRLEEPLRIVNLSLGLEQHSTELEQACASAANVGVFLVASVGNTGQAVLYPAAFPTTFAVAAVDAELESTGYSNFGDEVDLAAPGGVDTLDLWNDGWPDGVPGPVLDDTIHPPVASHGYLVGTSQAAPHVAGTAALLLSLDPSLTGAELKSILKGSARDIGPVGDDMAHGAGLLQTHEAVKLALEMAGTPLADPPALLLAAEAVKFHGFEQDKQLPLLNAGGGRLVVLGTPTTTDDGARWLSASLVPDDDIDAAVNASHVAIHVDRSAVPASPAHYAGTVRLTDVNGTIGAIRVVMLVSERNRLGECLLVVVIDADSGIARKRAIARAEQGYRYWFRDLPAATYVIKAGEDLDGDGFFCEAADACGWLGGASEEEALPVVFEPGSGPVTGLSITLTPP